MQHNEAVDTLQQVEAARRQTRSTLRQYWFPLVLFGVLSLVSAPLIAVFGGAVLAVYWPAAGILGGIATGRYYYRHEQAIGVEGRSRAYVLTAVGLVVGAVTVGFTAGATGNAMLAAIGPMLVVAAGYGVFAWLDRSVTLGLLAGGLAVVTVWLWRAGVAPETAAIVLAVAFGVATTGIGIAQRMAPGHPLAADRR